MFDLQAHANGVEGFVVQPRDVEALAAAMAGLLADPELRRRMGHAARDRVERDFTVDVMVDHLRRVYDRALAPGVPT